MPVTLFASALMMTLSWQPANAESACKGLEQAACTANAECRWQEGYTRKDGVVVSSYCRSMPKKKDSTAQPVPAPAVAPKTVVTPPAALAPPVVPAKQ